MEHESKFETYNGMPEWIPDHEIALVVAGLAKIIVPIHSNETAEQELANTQWEKGNTCGMQCLGRYKQAAVDGIVVGAFRICDDSNTRTR
jgi:hypothetical protein